MKAAASATRRILIERRNSGMMGRMEDPELIAQCEALATTKGGDFVRARRRAGGGYQVRIVTPPGADPGPASIDQDQVYIGDGNTPDDAMRDLLHHHF